MKCARIVSLTLLSLLLSLLPSATPQTLAAPPESPTSPADSVTVGEFAVQVARLVAAPGNPTEVLTPEQALASLKESGLTFGSASESILTQAEFAEFMKQAGLRMSVPSPEKPISQDQAKSVLAGFGTYFASRGSSNVKAPPPGLPDKHAPLPNSFEQCASLPKVPECRECCLDLGLSNKACGRACGRAHAALQTSPSEPTP